MVHQGGVESLERGEALNFVKDGVDVFVFELERFHLLVDEIADLDDVGDSAGVVAADDLPGEPAQAARVAERFQGMVQQCGLGQGLRRDPGAPAEFDGQGRGPSAMCLFGGMVEAHRNITIWRHARLRIKVQKLRTKAICLGVSVTGRSKTGSHWGFRCCRAFAVHRKNATGVGTGARLVDHPRQRLEIDRLRDIIVETRAETVFAIAAHRVSGHGDDRRVAARRAFGLADAGGGFKAVHLRHLQIHQDEIELLRGSGFDRTQSVARHQDGVSHLLYGSLRELLIDDVVFGEQDVKGRRRNGRPPVVPVVLRETAAIGLPPASNVAVK